LRLFSFGGYGLALVVFGAYGSYPFLPYALVMARNILRRYCYHRERVACRSNFVAVNFGVQSLEYNIPCALEAARVSERDILVRDDQRT